MISNNNVHHLCQLYSTQCPRRKLINIQSAKNISYTFLHCQVEAFFCITSHHFHISSILDPLPNWISSWICGNIKVASIFVLLIYLHLLTLLLVLKGRYFNKLLFIQGTKIKNLYKGNRFHVFHRSNFKYFSKFHSPFWLRLALKFKFFITTWGSFKKSICSGEYSVLKRDVWICFSEKKFNQNYTMMY